MRLVITYYNTRVSPGGSDVSLQDCPAGSRDPGQLLYSLDLTTDEC
jgi:hypothetical protein